MELEQVLHPEGLKQEDYIGQVRPLDLGDRVLEELLAELALSVQSEKSVVILHKCIQSRVSIEPTMVTLQKIENDVTNLQCKPLSQCNKFPPHLYAVPGPVLPALPDL